MNIRIVMGIMYLLYMFSIYISRWKGVECFTWRTIFKRHKLDEEWEDVIGLTNKSIRFVAWIEFSHLFDYFWAPCREVQNMELQKHTLKPFMNNSEIKISKCLRIKDFSFHWIHKCLFILMAQNVYGLDIYIVVKCHLYLNVKLCPHKLKV